TILINNRFSDTILSGVFSVQVPTGASRYSNGGADMMAELLLARRLKRIVLYSGFAFAYSTEDNYNGSKIRKNRPGGFIAIEYLWGEYKSIGASYSLTAHPNSPVEI